MLQTTGNPPVTGWNTHSCYWFVDQFLFRRSRCQSFQAFLRRYRPPRPSDRFCSYFEFQISELHPSFTNFVNSNRIKDLCLEHCCRCIFFDSVVWYVDTVASSIHEFHCRETNQNISPPSFFQNWFHQVVLILAWNCVFSLYPSSVVKTDFISGIYWQIQRLSMHWIT